MKENNITYSEKDVEEKIKLALKDREILISEQRDKISSLKAEVLRLLKERDEIDKREVEVASTIEKYEKKNKYLENIIKVRLALEIDNLDALRQKLETENNAECSQELEKIISSISAFSSDVTNIDNISDNNKNSSSEKNKDNLEERYLKLLSVYEYNKAFLGTKNRGRPKKEDDSIEGFLKEKKKQKDKEKENLLFDFDEALNPTESLEDIMKDLINDND
ncbi:MAG: hypothetical protein IJT25_02990 [Clostridia bacterium]|nr:hypothetical protein [Clostridia bacterium]